VRSSARHIAGDASAPFAIWRSALLTLLEVPLELFARGSALAWVFPHVLTALAYGGLALATLLLARRAGASVPASCAAASALALDRIAWADAPLGLPDGLATLLATLGLATGLALLEEPSRRRAFLTALFFGLAAAARPNAALPLGALALVALATPRPRTFVFAAAAGAVVVYLLLESAFFALGTGRPIASHLELARFQHVQFAENRERYGSVYSPLSVYVRAVFRMEPAVALLAPVSLGVALLRGDRRSAVLVAAVLIEVAFLVGLVGHGEARYLLPAMPALATLAALALDRIPARLALVAGVAWVALPLALALPFEARRALDPVMTRGFSQEVAREVAALAPSSTPVYWAPDLPFPVYPEVLGREGTPFPGDPFHGIAHAGPITIGYHLGRPVRHVIAAGGIAKLSDLDGFGEEGDLVLVGVFAPGISWRLGEPPPALEVRRVRREPRPHLELVATIRAR
jgi:hypothetical protein